MPTCAKLPRSWLGGLGGLGGPGRLSGALALALTASLALVPALAWSHKPSDSYLVISSTTKAEQARLEWHIALKDLDRELQLDADNDGRLSWKEVRTRWAELSDYSREHVSISADGQPCTLQASSTAPALIEHTDGRYVVLNWPLNCPAKVGVGVGVGANAASPNWQHLDIDYHLFALTDPTHRGIVRLTSTDAQNKMHEWGVRVLGVGEPVGHLRWQVSAATSPATPLATPPSASAVTPTATPISTTTPLLASATAATTGSAPPAAALTADADADADAESSITRILEQLGHSIRDGIEHIAEGTDHICFLLSLLLVCAFRRKAQATGLSHARTLIGQWEAQPSWRPVLREVLQLVSAFTVAHSITLALATLGIVSPPSRWVESLIALSVLLAALDNIWPLWRGPRWVATAAFGLVHGFGFAGVMQDLGLSREAIVWPLLGFNLGVEAGQLMLIALVLPPVMAFRHLAAYRRWVMVPGSSAIAALGLYWLVQRTVFTS